MIHRKKKLIFIQFFLLTIAILIIYFTYYNKDKNKDDIVLSKEVQEKIKKQSGEITSSDGDVFFNIEYKGLDLNGNRYILRSEEARLDEVKPEMVYMNIVHAIFYFKDDTKLNIFSDEGTYNNKTFDMKFKKNVKADYQNSKLYAANADYSNSENYLSIYGNVRVDDPNGNLIADKLLFDITKQKLDITSFNKGKINANVELNEKRF